MELHDASRNEALENVIQAMDKRYGAGTLMRLGDRPAAAVDVVPSGCASLDVALGIGGYPKGRVIEIYGPESSGKTTLTLQAIAQAQAAGGVAAFVDAEHALDVTYAEHLGVDLDNLLVAQPDSGEQALEILEGLVRSGGVDLVVVDSVAALVPQAELQGDMGDAHMGLQARLMSQALRKLTGITNRTGCIVIFINQIRQKIGQSFGNGEVTTGGNALKFYASIRIDIRRIGSLKQGEKVVGNKTRIRVVKNKLAPPFQTVETEIHYGDGICPAADLVRLGEQLGVVGKSGSWYSMGDERLGQGIHQVRDRLRADKALLARLDHLVRVAAGLVAEAEAVPEAK